MWYPIFDKSKPFGYLILARLTDRLDSLFIFVCTMLLFSWSIAVCTISSHLFLLNFRGFFGSFLEFPDSLLLKCLFGVIIGLGIKLISIISCMIILRLSFHLLNLWGDFVDYLSLFRFLFYGFLYRIRLTWDFYTISRS